MKKKKNENYIENNKYEQIVQSYLKFLLHVRKYVFKA